MNNKGSNNTLIFKKSDDLLIWRVGWFIANTQKHLINLN
jgi:hypothetical protein